MTIEYQLQPSFELLSHHHGTHTNIIKPCKSCHTTYGTHTNIMPCKSCHHPCDPWPIPTPTHSHAPTPFPFAILMPHVSCISPTHIFHLKYNSSCMLLCPNSDPAFLQYVISPHVITLTSSLSLTLHPHSHDIAVPCSSIKSCL